MPNKSKFKCCQYIDIYLATQLLLTNAVSVCRTWQEHNRHWWRLRWSEDWGERSWWWWWWQELQETKVNLFIIPTTVMMYLVVFVHSIVTLNLVMSLSHNCIHKIEDWAETRFVHELYRCKGLKLNPIGTIMIMTNTENI